MHPARSLFLALAASLAFAATADAADFTSSNITSPGAGSISLSTAVPTFTVSGTTAGGSPATSIDVRCYFANGLYETLGYGATANDATGNFSFQSGHEYSGGICHMRVVPEDLSDSADVSAFTGPTVTITVNDTDSETVSPNAGVQYDFYRAEPMSQGYTDWYSATDGGLYDSRLVYSDGTSSNWVFFGQGGAYSDANPDRDPTTRDPTSPVNRSYIQVDGKDAYGPYDADGENTTRPGLPALGLTQTGSGDTSATAEQNPLVRCSAADVVPTDGTCGNWITTGVRLDRTTSFADGGATIIQGDSLVSTDGQPHSVSLWYDEYFAGSGPFGSSITPAFRFPGESGFSTHSTGNVSTFGSSPATVELKTSKDAADNDPIQPLGAITFSRAPAAASFRSAREFTAQYADIAVPAGGTVSFTTTYAMRRTLAATDAAGAAARDAASTPSVSFATPGNGASLSGASTAVGGTATGGSTLALTVNGAAVPVAADGSWSAVVPLAPGANTITATATNPAGHSGQAAITVFDTPPADRTPPVVALKLASSVKRKTLLKSGITGTVTCNEACKVAGTLLGTLKGAHISKVGDIVLATKSLGLGTGARKVKVKPSKALGAKIHTGAKLRLTLVATDAAGNLTTKTSTVKVK